MNRVVDGGGDGVKNCCYRGSLPLGFRAIVGRKPLRKRRGLAWDDSK